MTGIGPCDDNGMSRQYTRRLWSFCFAFALPVVLLAGCASSDETTAGPASGNSSELAAPATTTVALVEPVPVTIGQPFVLDKPAGLGNPAATLTATVTAIDYAPTCGYFDYDTGEDTDKEFPYIAIEFDVSVNPGSGPVTFGSPGWFRATDAAGYVTDDLTIMVPDCDDEYPEFTDSQLASGQKHRGWVMFKDDNVQRGDSLTIGLPNVATKAAVLTLG